MFAFYMRIKNFLILFSIITATAFFLFFGSGGCASIVPPSGGPRDSLPPVMIKVDPPNQSTYFTARKILLQFDEYVELNNPFENMIVSPLPKLLPTVTRKLKSVTVKLKDSLEPNTTYVFNFKDVIKDVNEGNKAKDLLYVVSTGNYFDSLQLSGNVKIARTGKPDSTLTIMLYNKLNDSAVVKERPRYIAKPDSSGVFLFRFLAPGTYRMYALKSEGGAYLYTEEEQIFAFADDSIVLNSDVLHEPVQLYAYAEKEPENEQKNNDDDKEKRLKFITNLEGQKQDILQAFTITFANPLQTCDFEKMQLTTDTTFTPATGHRFSLDSTHRILTMNMTWQESTKYNLILEKDFAADSTGRQLLKKDTLTFTTKAKNEYGQVKLTFLNLDMSIHPVVLLMQNGRLKNSFPLKTNVLELALINPGEYEMQILHDKNENGIWDSGRFFMEHRQPELVTPLDRKLNVKPNWTTELEVKMQ
jgi:hypothetical protein